MEIRDRFVKMWQLLPGVVKNAIYKEFSQQRIFYILKNEDYKNLTTLKELIDSIGYHVEEHKRNAIELSKQIKKL